MSNDTLFNPHGMHRGGHSHHHGHHMMDTTTDSVLSTGPATTAATLLQAVMTTVMAHGMHDHHNHHHDAQMDSPHARHISDAGLLPQDSSHSSDIHANHVSAGDHMQVCNHCKITYSLIHRFWQRTSERAPQAGVEEMFFHFGVETIILFKEWTTSTTEGLIGSVIGIFIMAMLYEGIKFFREFLFKKYFTSLEYSSVSVLGDDGKPVTEVHKVARNRMFSWPHILQTCLHVIQMVVSYFLMLIFMTYNVWLCLAVVGGSGMGYFLFGWRKATVVDITEHCH